MNLKQLYEKYRDVIPYLFFGVCTTVVNMVVYWVAAHPLGLPVTVSNVIAWVFAVTFAYLTNRKWVFHSTAATGSELIREISSFFSCRLATGIMDTAMMFVFVDLLHFNDIVIKIIANVLVVVLNYVASKVLIFRKK